MEMEAPLWVEDNPMNAGADTAGSTTGGSPLIGTRTCFPTFSQPQPASTMNRAALRSMSTVPSSSLVPSDHIGVRVLFFFTVIVFPLLVSAHLTASYAKPSHPHTATSHSRRASGKSSAGTGNTRPEENEK